MRTSRRAVPGTSSGVLKLELCQLCLDNAVLSNTNIIRLDSNRQDLHDLLLEGGTELEGFDIALTSLLKPLDYRVANTGSVTLGWCTAYEPGDDTEGLFP